MASQQGGDGPAGPRAVRLTVVAAAAALAGVLAGSALTVAVVDGPAAPAVRADAALAVDGVSAVAAAVLPSVVRVDVRGIGVGASGEGGGPSGNASGIVWDDAGHIVTNHHVIAGATTIVVTFADGTAAEAVLVGSDPDSDLAVLRVDDVDHPAVVLAPQPAQVGQLAVALGSPFGLDGSVTAGIVSAVDRPVDLRVPDGSTVRLPGVLQTDAGINPGNSGGPLVDADGRLIGVASALLGQQLGGAVGFAIPAPLAVDVVGQLIDRGVVATPVLGIAGTSVTGAVAAALGVEGGVVVERVSAGTPAAEVGLRPGDILLAVGARPLRTVDDLLREVRRGGVGGTIEVVYTRDGVDRTARITLVGRDRHDDSDPDDSDPDDDEAGRTD